MSQTTPAIASKLEKCSVCSEPGSKKCARCETRYCSKACQTTDWKAHQTICYVYEKMNKLANQFNNTTQYSETLIDHTKRSSPGFESGCRRLIQFDFKSLKDLALMVDPAFLGRGGVVDVDIKYAKSNEIRDEHPGSQWAIAMDYTRGYDLLKEASVVFTIPFDDGYIIMPFVIELLIPNQ